MSFGLSGSDFAALGQFAWKIYKACKDAPEGFLNISQEVLSLQAALKELEEAYSGVDLPAAQQSRLRIIGDGCRAVLKDLQGLVDRYKSLGTNTKRTWDRLKWGSEDISQLRSRLTSNTVLLTTFLSTSQVTVQNKLDMLLKEFRDGKREGSIFSTQTADSLSTDERQAWHTIRKELQDIGISVAAFDSNKDFIMNWFKTAISTGAFEEKKENDEFTGVHFEDEVGQFLEDSEYENSQNRSSEEGEQENLHSTLSQLERRELHSKVEQQRQRPPRVGVLVNWLLRHNANLIKAVEAGEETKVQAALDQGADINAKSGKVTPLAAAISTGNEAMLQLLLKNGANINWKNWDGRTTLHSAALSGLEISIQLLLKYGAKVNSRDNHGRTALYLATESGHELVVQLLLEHGAKTNEKDGHGYTALHRAALSGLEISVRLLLEHGTNVNTRDKHGRTALYLATSSGNEQVVQLLLRYGAGVDAKTENGRTALHGAAYNGHETVVQILLKNRTSIDEKDSNGYTALHRAAGMGHIKVVQELLESGANVNEKNYFGKTALELARARGKRKIGKLLENAGAKR